MQSSSSTRSRASFVPWISALILGATAHAGWLVHELRSDAHASPESVIVNIEAVAPGSVAARASKTPRCRHARVEARSPAQVDLDLDLWIHKTDRYTYTVDRRALEHLAHARLDVDLGRLDLVTRALGVPDGIELRNIHGGSPLWWLGLRNGDRLLAMSSYGERGVERVEVSLARRGRPVSLIYEII